MIPNYRATVGGEDFFSTEPKFTNALLKTEKFSGKVWEPACGDGAISKVLEDAGYNVMSTDLVDRSYGSGGIDFLKTEITTDNKVPNIVTNPPFNLLDDFICHALALATHKVAMLMTLNHLGSSQARYKEFWSVLPPRKVIIICNRMTVRSAVTGKIIKSRFNHVWCIWDHRYTGPTELEWTIAK